MRQIADQTKVSDALERLFKTYPLAQKGNSAEEAARNRIIALQAYSEAVEDYDVQDVEAGIKSILSGNFPDHNPAYVPAAPQVGSACRRAMEYRLDAENRFKRLHPALPPPDVFKDDDSRARVLALKAEVLSNLADPFAADTEAKVKAKKEWQEKLDRRFEPDMSSRAVAERLGLIDRGYDVGDPEGDEAVA